MFDRWCWKFLFRRVSVVCRFARWNSIALCLRINVHNSQSSVVIERNNNERKKNHVKQSILNTYQFRIISFRQHFSNTLPLYLVFYWNRSLSPSILCTIILLYSRWNRIALRFCTMNNKNKSLTLHSNKNDIFFIYNLLWLLVAHLFVAHISVVLFCLIGTVNCIGQTYTWTHLDGILIIFSLFFIKNSALFICNITRIPTKAN